MEGTENLIRRGDSKRLTIGVIAEADVSTVVTKVFHIDDLSVSIGSDDSSIASTED